MTHLQQIQLETDLDAAVSDAELLAKQIIGNGIRFLAEAHGQSMWDIRVAIEDVIADLNLTPRTGIRLVN